MTSSNNGHLTVRQTAQRLGIDIAYTYQLLWRKKLAGRKVGTRWLISEAAVAARKKQGKGKQWQTT